MQQKKNILVSPLDWGLGHATRIMPLLRYVCEQKHHLTIGVNDLTSSFLRSQLPNATFLDIPSYNIRYSNSRSPFFLAKLIPRIIKAKKLEQQWVKTYVENHHVDLIISDSRFGFYHPAIPSMIISHQLNLQFSKKYYFVGKIAQVVNEKWLKQFNQIWVPDSKEQFLSGSLSQSKKLEAVFIDPQSRLENGIKPSPMSKEYILCILSGPEPQRTKLEELIVKQALSIKAQFVIIGGKPQEPKMQYEQGNIIYYNHLDDEQMSAFIQYAALIISRSGYSSIMDYFVMNCKRLFLVPTPGQSEQIYLAKRMKKLGICDFAFQHSFNLSKVVYSEKHYRGFRSPIIGKVVFKDVLNQLIS